MTETPKIDRRTYLRAAGAGVVGLAVGAVAGYYGGLSAAPQVAQPPTTVTKTVTEILTAAATAAEKKIFKVANTNAGPSGTTWGRAVLDGEKISKERIEKEFPNVEVKWYNSWDVKPTDISSIVEGYIADGINLIESGDIAQTIYKPIIEANPQIYFLEPYFTLATTPNAGSYSTDLHIGAFLTGIVGAAITKTKKIATVHAFQDPYNAQVHNCFRQGAKEVDPDVKCYYAITGDFHDVSLGLKAGTALIATGSDFLAGQGNGMTNGAIKAAQTAQVWAAGCLYDQNDLAPETVIVSTLWNCGDIWSDAIRGIMNGTYDHPYYSYDLWNSALVLTKFYQAVPDIVSQTIEKFKRLNKEGKYKLSDDKEWPKAAEVK